LTPEAFPATFRQILRASSKDPARACSSRYLL
jgi:hypothetical protein